MTERERIIEAGAIAAFNESTQHESEWADLPEGAKRVWRGEVAAALDAMLPLVLPEEPSERLLDESHEGVSHRYRVRAAFAARLKELEEQRRG